MVYIRLEEPISVTIDGRDGGVIGDGGMIRCNADNPALLLVRIVDSQETATIASLQEQPEVRPSSQTGAGDIGQTPALQVRDQVIGGKEGHQEVSPVGREQISYHRGDWDCQQAFIVHRK